MKTKNYKIIQVAAACCWAALAPAQTHPGSSPQAGAPIRLSELKSAAQITRDTWGIAHINAQNDHDLFFLQGHTAAQDRLFQMDVSRRIARGTLAELVGSAALPQDVQLRTIGR